MPVKHLSRPEKNSIGSLIQVSEMFLLVRESVGSVR